ncbi:MAG: sugar transferase, partial [Actinomycetota bacterium]
MSTLPDLDSGCSATSWVNSPVKRILDVIVASLLFTVLLPVLIIGAVGVRLTSPGPILFRHPRAGRDGRPISVLKLRTMRQTDVPGPHAPSPEDDEARLTPLGRFLRRFSIDE